jgi:hypothetical protein
MSSEPRGSYATHTRKEHSESDLPAGFRCCFVADLQILEPQSGCRSSQRQDISDELPKRNTPRLHVHRNTDSHQPADGGIHSNSSLLFHTSDREPGAPLLGNLPGSVEKPRERILALDDGGLHCVSHGGRQPTNFNDELIVK